MSQSGRPLSDAALKQASQILEVGRAELWSLVAVETKGCGFQTDRRPLILFERHYFSRLTGRKFDDRYPDISNPRAGGYGPPAHQYDRLSRAMQLDRTAALESASWGLGQVMGRNAKLAGFNDVEDMVAAMESSEDGQFLAVVNFIRSRKLDAALRRHDWAAFADGYNGETYAINQYDKKLKNSFEKYSNGQCPDLRVRTAQLCLSYCGFNPGAVDGVCGTKTRNAIIRFQVANHLAQTGVPDDALLAVLEASVFEPCQV